MKQHSSFLVFVKKCINRIIVWVGFVVPVISKTQIPSAHEIASRMEIGWNLGNTLEASCGEEVLGSSKTTQKLIDIVRASEGNNDFRVLILQGPTTFTIGNL